MELRPHVVPLGKSPFPEFVTPPILILEDREMTNTPVVFVAQENNRLNYTDAEQFGTVRFLTSREYSPMANSLINNDILDEIRAKMASFQPDTDFLLLSGNPVMIGYVFHLAMKIKGYVKLLQWDGMSTSYREVHFNPNGD